MIEEVRSSDSRSLASVRELFGEYADSLGPGHLCLQAFAAETAGLPGIYAAPAGGLWMARIDGDPAGCVALRPLGENDAELKRLYVRPRHRGHRLGRLLVEIAVARAREAGRGRVLLDTFPSMAEAVALYRSFGFSPTAAYHDKALPGALFFELTLTAGSSS